MFDYNFKNHNELIDYIENIYNIREYTIWYNLGDDNSNCSYHVSIFNYLMSNKCVIFVYNKLLVNYTIIVPKNIEKMSVEDKLTYDKPYGIKCENSTYMYASSCVVDAILESNTSIDFMVDMMNFMFKLRFWREYV